jgi:hypothetical protein
MTIEKGESVPFADPRMEGIACPDHLIETWLTIARATQLSQNGKASKKLRRAFIAAKVRVDQALRSATNAVFGIRQEYRVAWHVLLDIATSTVCLEPVSPATPYPFWKISCSDGLEYVRWDCNRWLAPIEYLHAQSLRKTDDVLELISLSSALFRCLRASLACGHLAGTNDLWKDDYKTKEGKQRHGLGFQSSLQQRQMVWLRPSSINWQLLSLDAGISATSYFSTNGIHFTFVHTEKIDLYNKAFQRILLLSKQLKQNLDNSEAIQDILQHMRQEVYRQFIARVLSDLREEFVDSDKQLDDCTQGLSADIIYELLGEEIYVAVPRMKAPKIRKKRASKRSTSKENIDHRPITRSQTQESPQELCRPIPLFLQRLQILFDWDDEYERKSWDRYAYRDLAKQSFERISQVLSTEAAIEWRSTLGVHAARYIWIYPNYNQDRLWTFTRKAGKREDKSKIVQRRRWLSGIYLPSINGASLETTWTLETAYEWKDAPWTRKQWMCGKPGGLEIKAVE